MSENEQDQEEKTEQASPRRRQKAREKGQVARSRELTSITAMSGMMLMFYLTGDTFMKNMAALTGELLGLQHGRDAFAVMRSAIVEVFMILLPFLGVTVIFAVFAAVLQGGFVLKPLKFRPEVLDPIKGFKKLVSKEGLMNFMKSLMKFVVGICTSYMVIKQVIFIIPPTSAMGIREIQGFSAGLIGRSVMTVFIIFFILAIIDYFIERWKFERSIRMTKADMKTEHKESEGDPLIKSRIKSIQREMARKRMMQEVPKATVVITNPTHIAVALMYENKGLAAPKVIAKGTGLIAGKIKETAEKHGVPVVEDKPLARSLYKLKLGSYIPAELYRAIAKILAYVYKLKGAA